MINVAVTMNGGKFALRTFLFLLMIILFYYLSCSVFLHNDNTEDNDNKEENDNIDVSSTEQPSNIHSKREVQDSLSQRGHSKMLDNERDFLFPYPNLTFEASKMLKSQWVVNMKRTVEEAKFSKQLTFLMVSFDYLSTLLNWLTHAKLNAPSLMKNLLVVCLDEKSHIILTKKGITSTIVKVKEVVKTLSDIDGTIFHARVVVRLTVLRLLSYWGFDVLQMDIDASLMKNVQPILDHFSDTDIISSTAGTAGHSCIPRVTRQAWKFCFCIGTILIRSNQNIGMYQYLYYYILYERSK